MNDSYCAVIINKKKINCKMLKNFCGLVYFSIKEMRFRRRNENKTKTTKENTSEFNTVVRVVVDKNCLEKRNKE